MRTLEPVAGRKVDGGDEILAIEGGVELRLGARQPMEITEGHRALALRPFHVNDGFQRGHGHAHVARMRRDTVLALAEDGMDAVESLDGATPTAGFALVALRKSRVVEIIAARALEQVAADGRHVAQLRTGPGEKRLTQNRVSRHDERVLSEIGIAHERADAHAALGQFLDFRERQLVDVDELVGTLDAHLHEVDQIGATAEEFGVFTGGNVFERGLLIRSAGVGKWIHG